MSAAKATGSAWKLPPDSASSVSAKISGLSETPLASVASVAAAWRSRSSSRAHHLRLAAQAIGVLHARVVVQMRGADRAARHQRAQRRRRPRSGRDGGASAWMRGSNGVSEPRAASVDSAPVTSAGTEQRFRLEQAGQRVGGGELRAVEQRQPLLRPQRQRRQAGRGERFRRRHATRRPKRDLADADHRRRHVGERREIARGADRALRRHDRHQPARQHRLEQRAASAGRTPEAPWARLASFSAIISRVDRDRRRLADAGGVRQHDVALQLREIGCGDAHARELAEAGIDAIDRLARARGCAPPPPRSPRRRAAPRDRARPPRRDRSRANRSSGTAPGATS